jgi:hypothetical protein
MTIVFEVRCAECKRLLAEQTTEDTKETAPFHSHCTACWSSSVTIRPIVQDATR